MTPLLRAYRPALLFAALLWLSAVGPCAGGTVYYVDSVAGDDANPGTSPDRPFKTLARAGRATYGPGSWLLLRRGRTFKGKLYLKGVTGTAATPVVIGAYGSGTAPPKIDSAGYIAGVQLDGCAHVVVRELEVVSDGGPAIDAAARTTRYGVYVMNGSRHVRLEALSLHDIYATVQTASEGKDGTTAYGFGVRIAGSSDVIVERIRVERVGRYGIVAASSSDLQILRNRTLHTGGSGLQMGRVVNAIVRGNVFDRPGSFVDPRMHGRGSGSWPWSSENVLYEENAFLHARGKADSAGVHIDFNCKNVIVQRNFSMDNAGGFIEVLGNCRNCAYRYNISVNDGWRKKGVAGAVAPGRTLWLSGYTGKGNPQSGPFFTYIYNNTVYTKRGMRGTFAIRPSARGILIANNVFFLEDGAAVERYPKPGGPIVYRNNLYNRAASIPAALAIKDTNPRIGDPGFVRKGGTTARDYVPANAAVVGDQGIVVSRLSGDPVGLLLGLAVTEDYFGNPIRGRPDLGAVEVR